ncbi:hypothetical protein [Pedobacter aquatilis]|uniref:hypothetical protein n=1 Tax=Pedobacter aquatilis TaxID=351343 RepID=UPI002931C16E|nr:hypothetical protein [Pedobacter aquatilis]
MKKSQTANYFLSQDIRVLMEQHIAQIFFSREIEKYLSINESGSIYCILNYCGKAAPKLSSIRLAYQIWINMSLSDRHAILYLFHTLLKSFSVAVSPGKRNLIFCTLFINELTGLLDDMMMSRS